MEAWARRAVEEANLFNPAFCAMLIAKACKDYLARGQEPLAFPLAFLVLPLVLHPRTRAVLPYSTVTSLLSWTQEHRSDLAEFATHSRRLLPYTREAVMFGITRKVLEINPSGQLQVGGGYTSPTPKRTGLFTGEVRDCLDRAGFVGRWFADAGTPSTIYSAFGVSP